VQVPAVKHFPRNDADHQRSETQRTGEPWYVTLTSDVLGINERVVRNADDYEREKAILKGARR
jgi:hypothetical protein